MFTGNGVPIDSAYPNLLKFQTTFSTKYSDLPEAVRQLDCVEQASGDRACVTFLGLRTIDSEQHRFTHAAPFSIENQMNMQEHIDSAQPVISFQLPSREERNKALLAIDDPQTRLLALLHGQDYWYSRQDFQSWKIKDGRIVRPDNSIVEIQGQDDPESLDSDWALFVAPHINKSKEGPFITKNGSIVATSTKALTTALPIYSCLEGSKVSSADGLRVLAALVLHEQGAPRNAMTKKNPDQLKIKDVNEQTGELSLMPELSPDVLEILLQLRKKRIAMGARPNDGLFDYADIPRTEDSIDGVWKRLNKLTIAQHDGLAVFPGKEQTRELIRQCFPNDPLSQLLVWLRVPPNLVEFSDIENATVENDAIVIHIANGAGSSKATKKVSLVFDKDDTIVNDFLESRRNSKNKKIVGGRLLATLNNGVLNVVGKAPITDTVKTFATKHPEFGGFARNISPWQAYRAYLATHLANEKISIAKIEGTRFLNIRSDGHLLNTSLSDDVKQLMLDYKNCMVGHYKNPVGRKDHLWDDFREGKFKASIERHKTQMAGIAALANVAAKYTLSGSGPDTHATEEMEIDRSTAEPSQSTGKRRARHTSESRMDDGDLSELSDLPGFNADQTRSGFVTPEDGDATSAHGKGVDPDLFRPPKRLKRNPPVTPIYRDSSDPEALSSTPLSVDMKDPDAVPDAIAAGSDGVLMKEKALLKSINEILGSFDFDAGSPIDGEASNNAGDDRTTADHIADALTRINNRSKQIPRAKYESILEETIPLCIRYLPMLSREGKAHIVQFIGREMNDPFLGGRHRARNAEDRYAERRALIKKLIEGEFNKKPNDKNELPNRLEERERVCEAFYFFLEHDPKNPSPANQLTYEMSQSCDGVDELQEQLAKHATENFSKYLKKLSNTGFIIEYNAALVAIFQSVQEVCKNRTEEEMLSALPFLVRNLARRLQTQERSNIPPHARESVIDSLSHIACSFYSQPRRTVERWRALTTRPTDVDSPVSECAAKIEDPHLLILDGGDLLAANMCAENLKDSPLKLFIFDADTGYSVGMVGGWEHVEKLALQDGPITAENMVEFFEILYQANPHGGSKLRTNGVEYPVDEEKLTQEGLADLIRFRDQLGKLEIEGKPRIFFSINNTEVRSPKLDRVKKLGMKLHCDKTNPVALKKCIDVVLAPYNENLKDLEKSESVDITNARFENIEDEAMNASKELDRLHSGYDGNGRVCAYFVRNVCRMKGQRKLGLKPSILVFSDPYSIEVKSTKQGRDDVEEAKKLSKGELSIADTYCGFENLTLGEAMRLNVKYPRAEDKRDEPGWVLVDMPDNDAAYEVEQVRQENGVIKSVVFGQFDKTPVEIYKPLLKEIPPRVLEGIRYSVKKFRFRPLTDKEIDAARVRNKVTARPIESYKIRRRVKKW